ncbi:MAG: prepilin peptidase [Candidatus Pacebacteria bacterium]|nr:prepilin peptidase [Candidatus Paceibacterota bacterium]
MLASALVFTLFGAIIGSFLNVLILRHGVKTILGRSECASCGHELQAIDLVPILSWLILGGRCRYCGSKISAQYPIVEALTAIAFGFVGATPLPLSVQVLALPILALLIMISVYDFFHGIIPDAWSYAFAGFSLVFSLAYLTLIGQLSDFTALFISGPACALPFAALWFVSRGQWMGLGDAKLAWGIGWLLGPLYAFTAIVTAFVLGALISVFVLLPLSSPKFWAFLRHVTPNRSSSLISWGFTMKSEVAFGPFLAVSCAVIWLLLLFGLDPLNLLEAGPFAYLNVGLF